MRIHKILVSVFTVACGLAAGNSAAQSADAAPPYVKAAVDFMGRPQFDVYRDKDLKPAEIMAFSGIKPGMVVANILPETGYWARIASVIVGPKGAVYMVVPLVTVPDAGRDTRTIKDPNQNQPYTRTEVAESVADQPEFHNFSVYWETISAHLNVPKQLDAVVLAGGYHTLKSDFPKTDTAEMDKAIFRAMKSGGTYLVIDAAANKGTGFTAASLGRSDADAVKAEVLAAGFQLAGESNVLSRAGDSHSAAADDTSDMYVLRFLKPANAPNSDKRPANVQQAMAGYFGLTRQTNPGLIHEGGVGHTERRVMFRPDMTYEEYGQRGVGNGPWQSGIIYFGADGDGCMLHLFPLDQKGFIACSSGRVSPGKKLGDTWFADGEIRTFVGKGYIPFPDKPPSVGGTLGDTPQEIARGFGSVYKLSEEANATPAYLAEYLTAYSHFRAAANVPAATLDAEFASAYGKPVPQMPQAKN